MRAPFHPFRWLQISTGRTPDSEIQLQLPRIASPSTRHAVIHEMPPRAPVLAARVLFHDPRGLAPERSPAPHGPDPIARRARRLGHVHDRLGVALAQKPPSALPAPWR